MRLSLTVIDRKTGIEADPCKIALEEGWAQDLVYCDIEGFGILEDGSLIIADECGNYVFCDPARFDVTLTIEGVHSG